MRLRTKRVRKLVGTTEEKALFGLERIDVAQLKGVGSKLAEKLASIDIRSLQDLLFHLPLRYQDRTRFHAIGSLRPGSEGLVQGEILLSQVKFGRRRSLLVRVSDGTGTLTLRFFHFSRTQEQGFRRGMFVRCYGEARRGPDSLEIVHPEYTVGETPFTDALETTLTAVYPTIEGIGQKVWRSLIHQALVHLQQAPNMLRDLLPQDIGNTVQMASLEAAVYQLHSPGEVDARLLARARSRLAFEELLAHHLSLRRLRVRNARRQAPVLSTNQSLREGFMAGLAFELTAAQVRVLSEIETDLRAGFPMMRLVQGDVGSGKTVVAAIAALAAVSQGFQVAIMAPTEILAEQHYRNFAHWMQPLALEVAWLAGSQNAADRRAALAAIAGDAQIIVGTHALFQDGVDFRQLGLVIVDEQHRFGVHQRLALRNKGHKNGLFPHQLVMTATPIPRTLAMTAYADLEVSIIDELPKGRQAINTVVVSQQRRPDVMARVYQACGEGRQVYWVCPLIEESDLLEAQAAQETYATFREAYPEIPVGLVHGRMKSVEKEQVMSEFKSGEIHLLVATTVIEVGVDVPNASLMVIENAERLGLSQLHQLRGRVGRGAVKSDCVLLYKAPLSKQGKERLATMRETQDGFRIAEKDLELRGPGELLGTRQTGMLNFRIADLEKDKHLLDKVDLAANLLLNKYPENTAPLLRRWLGQGMKYSDA
ncbi:MAG: ATP-dependent DNA helicase RecG [Gammaproteobacteria bacterium]|nr:ATP-dependent DNA helicase RecG [Gammaproteobacteria bacterium]